MFITIKQCMRTGWYQVPIIEVFFFYKNYKIKYGSMSTPQYLSLKKGDRESLFKHDAKVCETVIISPNVFFKVFELRL